MWFTNFIELILKERFSACEADPTVFWGITFVGYVILAVYVDDMSITGNDLSRINHVKAFLHQHLTIRDLGHLKYFLGTEFAY